MVRAEGPPEPMMMPVRIVGNLVGLEAGILDRLFHRDVVPGRAFAEEAHRAAVDHVRRIERRRALHLGAEAEFGIFVRARDPGLRRMEARKHFLGVVSDGRDDAHPRDDNPPHDRLALPLRFYVMAAAEAKTALRGPSNYLTFPAAPRHPA